MAMRSLRPAIARTCATKWVDSTSFGSVHVVFGVVVFFLDRTEVTVGSYSGPPVDRDCASSVPPGLLDYPATCVTFAAATALSCAMVWLFLPHRPTAGAARERGVLRQSALMGAALQKAGIWTWVAPVSGLNHTGIIIVASITTKHRSRPGHVSREKA